MSNGFRTLRVLVATAAAGAVAGTAIAAAPHHQSTAKPDSDAPAGGRAHWLPNEPWVMQHWAPFDESRLYALLKIDRKTLMKHLRTPGNTIAGLAKSHGYADSETLVDALVPQDLPAAQKRTREERTARVLTQSHLAQHLFGHLFHDPQLRRNAKAIYGVTPKELRKERREGRTPAQVGSEHGRSKDALADAIVAQLKKGYDDGVARGEVSREQAQAMLARQTARLPKFLDHAKRTP